MKVYLVGGAVRDELLGLIPKDRDYVVVGSSAEEMLAQGFQQVGADFPVFLHPLTGEEYALARQERKTKPGYHGFEVTFDPSVTLEQDLLRRDLTINAMAKDLETGELIDPHGGAADLRAGVLKHTSAAFAEDPIRVLRVARFMARYPSFKVHPKTIELAQKLALESELMTVTPERLWVETWKILGEPFPERAFSCLYQMLALTGSGLVNLVRPGVDLVPSQAGTFSQAEQALRYLKLEKLSKAEAAQLRVPFDLWKLAQLHDEVRRVVSVAWNVREITKLFERHREWLRDQVTLKDVQDLWIRDDGDESINERFRRLDRALSAFLGLDLTEPLADVPVKERSAKAVELKQAVVSAALNG